MRLPTIPRVERRSAGIFLALAVCVAVVIGAVRGIASILDNDYLALGMPRLALVTLHGHLRQAISNMALPIAALAVPAKRIASVRARLVARFWGGALALTRATEIGFRHAMPAGPTPSSPLPASRELTNVPWPRGSDADPNPSTPRGPSA